MPDDPMIDDDHSANLRNYAKNVLHSLFPDTLEGNQEYEDLLKGNAAEVRRTFRFEDKRIMRTNKLLRKAMSVKVPILSVFSDVKNEGVRFFERNMLHMTLIDIKAHQVGSP
jgi:hypothetical protein